MSNGNRTAAEHGTIAVLAIQTRGAARAMPFDQMLEVNAGPTTTRVQRDGRPFDPLYGMQAAAMVSPKMAPLLFDGAPRTLDEVLDEADRTDGHPAGFPLKTMADLHSTTTVRR